MSVRKEVFYHNAKALLGKPTKRVWFRLNPLLEKTSLFVMKKQDNSQFTMPLQSVVICERILDDETAFQATCTEADFWDYLFADNWKNWSCVRVFDGQLMESLLENLHALDKMNTIASHQTGVFTQNVRHIKRPLKGTDVWMSSSEPKANWKCPTKRLQLRIYFEQLFRILRPQVSREVKEHLKISFTYYGTRKGKLESVFDGSICPTETVSMPDIEDVLSSDEEIELADTLPEDGCQAPHSSTDRESAANETPTTRRSRSFTSGSYENISATESESFNSSSRSEDGRFSVVTPNRVLHTLRGPNVSYKEWMKNRQAALREIRGDDRFLPSIYTLPHFHCARPANTPQSPPAVEKKETKPPPEGGGIEQSSKWLVQTMQNPAKYSQRTVDRLRQRLSEVVEERNKHKTKPKPTKGEHFSEAMRMVSDYADSSMEWPVFTRCYKAPTFEQYLVKLIKDREYDLRRYRRRVYKHPPRGKSLKNKDEFDVIVDESLDWKSPPGSPEKKGKNKKTKNDDKKSTQQEKGRKNTLTRKASPGSTLRSTAIKEEAENDDNSSSSDEENNNLQGWKTENMVDIVVGITDCVAFRNDLEMIHGTDEEARRRQKLSPLTPNSAQLSPDGRAGSKNNSVSNPQTPSSGANSEVDEAKSAITLTPSPLSASDLKGIQPNRLDSSSSTPPKSPASVQSQEKDSHSSSPDKSPTFGDETGSSRGPSDLMINPDYPMSPVSGTSIAPELFDARKINRKYSFDKLRAKRKSQKKRGFKDILKKFTRIQKIAAIFRKGAMVKPKRGKKKAFKNPLCITPSPEPMDEFIGQIRERRGGLKPKEVIVPEFKSPSIEQFRSKLLLAMDQFVVRKEQVISNYRNRSLTSVTFTRPEVFSYIHVGL